MFSFFVVMLQNMFDGRMNPTMAPLGNPHP